MIKIVDLLEAFMNEIIKREIQFHSVSGVKVILYIQSQSGYLNHLTTLQQVYYPTQQNKRYWSMSQNISRA